MTETEITGETSDGYHTFNELYDHRRTLLAALTKLSPRISWRSKRHFDDENFPMFEGMFVVGMDLPTGQITYHIDDAYEHLFDHVPALFRAKEYDGHSPADVVNRLQKWVFDV
jgi:hypothetical protein